MYLIVYKIHVVWEHGDCTGKSERIAPGTPHHHNLGELVLNDAITSFQLCSGSETEPNRPPSSELSEVHRVAVDEHNNKRRRHRSPDLRGDNDEIHQAAQRYAEYLVGNDKFEHSGNPKYGENLAGTGGGNQVEAVRNAESKYDYNNPGFSMETGHFTAVVWKSTTHVGIGVAWNPKKNWWVVVANYSPPGNYDGQYSENVFPPSHACQVGVSVLSNTSKRSYLFILIKISDKMTPNTQYSCIFLTVILISISINQAVVVDAQKVRFYEDPNYEGWWIEFPLRGSSCSNLPEEWINRVSSVNNQDNCLVVWDHDGCRGKSERIERGSPNHHQLSALGFNDQISSFQQCSGSDSGHVTGPGSPGSTPGQGSHTPPPRPPPSSESSNLLGIRRVVVDEHNELRGRHRSPYINGDDEQLHRSAQQHADYLANSDRFENSASSRYGENLAAVQGANEADAVRNAVRMWYRGESKYDYNNPNYQREAGTFTQLVWKSSTNVGIGVSYNSKKNWWVVVANYNPPGNVHGQFRENVLPPYQLGAPFGLKPKN
ncbi:Protein PRY1 [Orchesella cincta]|uniref:Protein PRY1 n=1 Tax=Orchesella cincta TaxID=48709 RepID=A0A1D2MED5_ORCCI|nr:Protein PRY1 [Orchesella cincta]